MALAWGASLVEDLEEFFDPLACELTQMGGEALPVVVAPARICRAHTKVLVANPSPRPRDHVENKPVRHTPVYGGHAAKAS